MESEIKVTGTSEVLHSVVKNKKEDHSAKDVELRNSPSYRNEYIAAFGVSLGSLFSGLSATWPATSIPLLLQPDSPIQLENHHIPMIVTFIQLGMLPGAIFTSLFADYIGRQRIILWITIPFFISSIITAFSTNVSHILIGRLLAGLGIGATFTVVPVYISEIASPAIRGKLSFAVNATANSVGILYMYIASPYMTVKRNALFCSFIPVLMFAIMYINPESPYFLLKKNRGADAREALINLRNQEDVEEELIRIRVGVKEQKAQKSSPLELFKGSNRKPLAIIGFTFFLRQFCGATVYFSYSQLLFISTRTKLPVDFCGMLIPIISIVVLFLSGKLSDKSGRLQLLRISCFGTALINFLVSSFFYLQDKGYAYIDFLSTIPVLCIMFFNSVFFFGIGTIPYLLMVELMPTNVRAWSTCFFIIFLSVLSMGSVFWYEFLKNNLGKAFGFLTFGCCTLVGGILVKYVIPETRGLSLEQIQEIIKGKKKDHESFKI